LHQLAIFPVTGRLLFGPFLDRQLFFLDCYSDVGVCACSTGNPGANEGKSRTVYGFQLSMHVEFNEVEVGFQNSQPLQPPMPGIPAPFLREEFQKTFASDLIICSHRRSYNNGQVLNILPDYVG